MCGLGCGKNTAKSGKGLKFFKIVFLPIQKIDFRVYQGLLFPKAKKRDAMCPYIKLEVKKLSLNTYLG